MVVTDFYVKSVIVVTSDKANTVLVIDSDAVLAFSVAFERLKAVAGRITKVVHYLSGIKYFELATGSRCASEAKSGLTSDAEEASGCLGSSTPRIGLL